MERAIEQSLFGGLFDAEAAATKDPSAKGIEPTQPEDAGERELGDSDLDDGAVPSTARSGSAARSASGSPAGIADNAGAADGTGELPQRVLAPMLKSYTEMKTRYPEHLLLFQVGDFYEIFFEDARIAADALSIRLTSRDKDQVDPIPMCGVPIHALDNYLPRLLKGGFSCVIVSQLDGPTEDAKGKKGPIRREITRIVTPGVRFEGDGLDEKQFNYLAALCVSNTGFGVLAFVDVSTGHLKIAEAESVEGLEELLKRVGPSELIVPSTLFDVPVTSRDDWMRSVQQIAAAAGTRVVKRPFLQVTRKEIGDRLEKLLSQGGSSDQTGALSQMLETLPPVALATVLASIQYVEEVSFTARPALSAFTVEQPATSLAVDSVTRRNLELTHNRQTGERKHSLLAAIDYTRTAMGCRLLAERLIAPSRNLAEITARHDAVAEMTGDQVRLDSLRQAFVGVRDLDRLVSRVTSARANPNDLRVLSDSLQTLPDIGQLCSVYTSEVLAQLHAHFDDLKDIADYLDSALVDAPPVRSNEGGIFKDGFDAEVDSLRSIRGDGKAWLLRLEQSEREKTGISALRIKYNNVFGYFIEVSKAHLAKVPAHFDRKQTLANAERFVTQELKEKEVSLLGAKARQIELERELFTELRSWVAERAGRIQRTSHVLSELDVIASFSYLADRHKYCRPVMRADQEMIIKNGRHPVVEQVLGAHHFVPNDSYLNGGPRRFAILTGPNMGGKSTYLRQIGLIQLLAQAGSFVPAEQAELGVVDRIFTRIGAADDLTRGDSTFMVEMREAAIILRKATSRSLVLIDEVGRGTATSDGLAIATAVAEWLHDAIGCRTVFATHFHPLTELSSHNEGAFCLSVGVIETGGEISFTHRIEERMADKSYGIEVARLAGLPEKLLRRAEAVLAQLGDERLGGAVVAKLPVDSAAQAAAGPAATFGSSPDAAGDGTVRAVLERLRNFSPERITPLQALMELAELKQLIDESETR